MAEGIAGYLRESGQLNDYKIGVKYQDGTTWLTGRVRSEEQMTTALKLVLQLQDVSRVINNLSIVPADSQPVAKKATLKRDTTVRIGVVSPSPSPLASGRSTLSRRLTQSTSPQQPAGIMQPESMRSSISRPSAAERLQRTRRPSGQPAAVESSRQVKNIRGASNDPNRAQRVPTTFVAAPARRTSHQQPVARRQAPRRSQTPRPMSPAMAGRPRQASHQAPAGGDPAYAGRGGPQPTFTPQPGGRAAPVRYDQPYMPNHAWPSYAAYPNYAAVTYPKQYSPTAWPYIGPFYPYPQVPLGWRKVTLEWDDGWWMLDFKDR
jgi:hypothetical protein